MADRERPRISGILDDDHKTDGTPFGRQEHTAILKSLQTWRFAGKHGKNPDDPITRDYGVPISGPMTLRGSFPIGKAWCVISWSTPAPEAQPR